jgi:hypothetical protein
LNRRLRIWNGIAAAGLGLGLSLLVGCDYTPPNAVPTAKGTFTPGVGPKGLSPRGGGRAPNVSSRRSPEERKAILDNSINLIQRASLKPGGDNFKLAVAKLNQYFAGTDPAEYQLDSAAREYLVSQAGPQAINQLQGEEWTIRDTRHIEDCMMYYTIANRVAGAGDDLVRARRVFDWIIRQVELVPAGSFGAGRLGPAFSRPYDVLVRGMASESEGTIWAERAWIFMAFCRQLGIDAGLITFTRGNTLDAMMPQQDPTAARRAVKPRVVWICGVVTGDQIYLFDARLGLEVPGPGGQGVATLEQALDDSSILERMAIPGLAPYSASQAALLSSPTKIGILIDSSPGYFSPKMKLLQRELSGNDRAILFNDPAHERDKFVRALGPRAGAVALWELPLQVESRLFTDTQYVEAIKRSLFLFQSEFPLIYARVKQLRGESDEAIAEYMGARFREGQPVVTNKKQTIPKDIQAGIDAYATYYLALAHLERNNLKDAEKLFRHTLDLAPEPKMGKDPHYYMLRWGANANLARIHEALKDDKTAEKYYSQPDPTAQHVGNLLRARELVWRNPILGP